MESQASVPRDVFPPTPPGPEGSNGNGLFRVQQVAGAWLFSSGHRAIGPSDDLMPVSVMTKRLYYDQPDLMEFDSTVEQALAAGDSSSSSRPAVILRESAFYPNSGGQVHDTGWLTIGSERVRVAQVAENDAGAVVHYLDASARLPATGSLVRG